MCLWIIFDKNHFLLYFIIFEKEFFLIFLYHIDWSSHLALPYFSKLFKELYIYGKVKNEDNYKSFVRTFLMLFQVLRNTDENY